MPPEVASSRKDSQYSGRIVVRLTPPVVDTITQWAQAHTGDLTSLQEVASELHLSELSDLLAQYPNLPTQRAVSNAPTLALLDLEATAAESSYPPLHSLVGYYIVDPRNRVEAADQLLHDFASNSSIELAYREPGVGEAGVTPEDETAYPNHYKGHFDGKFLGIHARSARVWGVCDGSGIGLVDLEAGWNLDHEDLPTPRPPVYNYNRRPGNHGTAVLGVVVGQDNGRGIVGIAPGATLLKVVSYIKPPPAPAPAFVRIPPIDEWDVAGAITDALTSGLMQRGDVFLIEVEALGSSDIVGYPIETVELWFDAIRLAVGNHMVVVEAAGNGDGEGVGRDLNLWSDPATGRKLSRAVGSDSGAILVSACASAIAPAKAHVRLEFANYGSRIDCYAWGQNVYSAGYGDLPPATSDVNRKYTKKFGGTSSASAIIAGAAILVQCMAVHVTGDRLKPALVRKLLSYADTGTPVLTPSGDLRIGVMPDLEEVFGRLPTVLPAVPV